MKTLSVIQAIVVVAAVHAWGGINPVDLPLPMVGTDGHGHAFPGSTVPFGMVQLSPDTRLDTWDGCSGYHYSDSTILGFSHTHLSGTGCGCMGDVMLMPTVGEVTLDAGSPGKGYASRFSHQNEKATPGYYQVFLETPKVNVELTTTERCGLHQYTFPASDQAHHHDLALFSLGLWFMESCARPPSRQSRLKTIRPSVASGLPKVGAAAGPCIS